MDCVISDKPVIWSTKKKMGLFTIFRSDRNDPCEIFISPNSALAYVKEEKEVYKILINGYVTRTFKSELKKMCYFLGLEFVE